MTILTQLRHFWLPPLSAPKQAALLLIQAERDLLSARLHLVQSKALVASLEMEVEVLREVAGVDISDSAG